MKRKYSISEYNYDVVLKIPFQLWLCIIYLSRYFMFIAAIGASARLSSKTKNLMPTDTMGFLISALVSMLALFVLVAAFKRNARAGYLVRKIWRNAKLLLIISSSGDLALLGFMQYFYSVRLESHTLLFIVLDLCVLAYLIFSHRARDTFLEFPEKEK